MTWIREYIVCALIEAGGRCFPLQPFAVDSFLPAIFVNSSIAWKQQMKLTTARNSMKGLTSASDLEIFRKRNQIFVSRGGPV